jgi:UTP--glucose-1-phosphate uridylyltransferase
MGAAIGVFEGAGAIEVDRSRFLPVKATSDLLVLRSDAYELAEGAQVRLAPERTAAPLVDLDKPYKLVNDFDARFPYGPPSLVRSDQLTVKGDWTFGRDVLVVGVAAVSAEGSPGAIADGSVLGDG